MARAAAQRALDLDPSEPMAHVLLGMVAGLFDYDWKSADEHLRRAKAAGPLDPQLRTRSTLIFMPRGRFAEAIEEFEGAIAQDPLNIVARSALALVLFLSGQYDRAIAEGKAALELGQFSPWAPLFAIAGSYLSLGMLKEAREWAEEAHRLVPWGQGGAGLLAATLERLGEREAAGKLLGQAQSRHDLLYYHLFCSNLDAAAEYLEGFIDQRNSLVATLASSELVKPLRQTPRWAAIARKMNLPPESGG